MSEQWPATLPDATLEANPVLMSPTVRTQMESGRTRQRRRFTTDIRQTPVRWKLTQAQWDIFQTFFSDTINAGSDYFLLDLRLGGGLKQYSARIVEGKYSLVYDNPFWVVSATLELNQVDIPTEEELDLAILYDQVDELEVAADHLHQLIHVTLPLVTPF